MVTADSFGGRVLAVLSRRSPAFRPPETPTNKASFTTNPPANKTKKTSFADFLERKQFELDRRLDRRFAIDVTDTERIIRRSLYGAALTKLKETRASLSEARDLCRGVPYDLLRSRQRALATASLVEYAHRSALEMSELFTGPNAERNGWIDPYAGGAAMRLAANLKTLTLAILSTPRLYTRSMLREAYGKIDAATISVDRAVKKIQRSVDDFTGSDLSNANLHGINLVGLMWSESTIWPSDWVDRVRRASQEREPGVYVIISGGTGRSSNMLEGV